MAERIQFQTQDGVTIVADWSPAPTMIGAVVLVHMMPETRKSWAAFSAELVKRGLGALAIDLRGHGDSTETVEGDVLDYQKFKDDEHRAGMYDVASAIDWLRGRGIETSRIALCGASIGANLALLMLTEEPRMPGAVLFSPGADYHGLKALEDAQNLLPHQALYIVSSEEDTQSIDSSRMLYEQAPIDTKIFTPYKTPGHGTEILSADAGLGTKVANWLSEIVKG